MSEMSTAARAKAKSKAERLVRNDPHETVDASNYRPDGAMDADAQVGMRPLTRKRFKSGGKVSGEAIKARADRKPRASGGLTANSFINRNVKDANSEREGADLQHGAMKKGGRTAKFAGGPMMGRPGMPASRPMPMTRPMGRAFASGGKVHGKECRCEKCNGGAAYASGGGIPDGTRPVGGRTPRASGGRAKKGMNVNIIIAPQGGGAGAKPAMPMPPPGGPVGLHQGAPPPPMAPPGAAPPMGPPPMMRKAGGRVENVPANKLGKYPLKNGSGGGMGRREKARAYG